jgi:excisionase family DNA binding protein
VSFEEAAQCLGVSLRTVQRRVKDGHLNTIESAGARLVCLAPDATEDATSDKPCRDSDATARQIDATKRDSEPDPTGEVLALLKSENAFLRGMLEARDRDAAELRAALRKALEAMPKALPDATTPLAENIGRENAPQAPIIPAADVTPVAQKQSAKPRKLTAWQRIGARILGIR